jgi:hypothetical protein
MKSLTTVLFDISMRNLPHLSITLLSIAFVGCGHSDGRQAVSGQVTLDGQPLLNATINFRPAGHKANSSGTTVREGLFRLPAKKGLMPGKYDVSIQAYREAGRMFHDPQRGEVPELAPIRFQADALQQVVVRNAIPNAFEFHLRSAD